MIKHELLRDLTQEGTKVHNDISGDDSYISVITFQFQIKRYIACPFLNLRVWEKLRIPYPNLPVPLPIHENKIVKKRQG